MRFRRKREIKRSVFAENAEWNGAFSAITRYSRRSSYVLGFNTYLNYIFEILGLGLVYYWMMPKNCEKRTIKSRACVPLRCSLTIDTGFNIRVYKIKSALYVGTLLCFYFWSETIQFCDEINKYHKEMKKFRQKFRNFAKNEIILCWKSTKIFFQRNSNSKAWITKWKYTQYFVLDFKFEFSWDHLQSHSSELSSHKKMVIEARICRSVYRDWDGIKRIHVHDQWGTK